MDFFVFREMRSDAGKVLLLGYYTMDGDVPSLWK